MSRYLVDRIAARPNVEVLTETEVTALEGHGGVLEAIRWRSAHRPGTTAANPPSVPVHRRRAEHRWLSRSGVALDDKGFVRTGADLGGGGRPLETSRDGVFAIGDVRAGSIKRVAAAVGEGAQVVATLHAFLAEAGDQPPSMPILREF